NPRDQSEGTPATLQPRLEQALIIERAGKIAVRHAISRIEPNRPPITVRRLGQPAQLPQRVAEVQMGLRQIVQFGDRALDQLDRGFELTALKCYEAQQMKRLRMLRVFLQRLAIEGRRLIEFPALVVG